MVLLCLLVLTLLFVFLYAAQVNSCQCCLFSLLLYFASVCTFGYKSLPVLLHLIFLSRLLSLASFSVSLAEGFPAVPAVENPEAATVPTPRWQLVGSRGVKSVQLPPCFNSYVFSHGTVPPAAAALLTSLGFGPELMKVLKHMGLCSQPGSVIAGLGFSYPSESPSDVCSFVSLPHLSSAIHLCPGADHCPYK